MQTCILSFMSAVAEGYQSAGCFGTAHIYRSSLRALAAFHGKKRLPFRSLTSGYLKRYETHLRGRGCSWNTVSTYMRMLRAVYNRAVGLRLAPCAPQLFRHVYTGTRADRKRALDAAGMARIMKQVEDRALPLALRRTSGLFALMFLLRGIPFVDLAYLKKRDWEGNVISYRRRKTGRMLTVSLPREAVRLLHLYINKDPDSPYLFPFLRSADGTRQAYREYQQALRRFNARLAALSVLQGMKGRLSSYTPRHTWATMAYYCEIHPGVISEAMGHSSITVTETYLKPFRNEKIDRANEQVIAYVKGRI